MSHYSRRIFVGTSAISIFGLTGLPLLANSGTRITGMGPGSSPFPEHFPAQDAASVNEVVATAHGQFDRLKELVNARPDLAKATWDWGFGDWESALGAASHMGRRDIAEFLIGHGARANIYTFAMLGQLDAVRSAVEGVPGIQRVRGPHGITLLSHARNRLRHDDVTDPERANVESVISYLQELGDADIQEPNMDISEDDQKTYLGRYNFGQEDSEYFQVVLNRRGMLYMQRAEKIGRVLKRVHAHAFAPGGAPSVRVRFEVEDGKARSLSVHDPALIVKAVRA